jgi:TRAP-type C4-dicarboxylate transport system permease small subunit
LTTTLNNLAPIIVGCSTGILVQALLTSLLIQIINWNYSYANNDDYSTMTNMEEVTVSLSQPCPLALIVFYALIFLAQQLSKIAVKIVGIIDEEYRLEFLSASSFSSASSLPWHFFEAASIRRLKFDKSPEITQ